MRPTRRFTARRPAAAARRARQTLAAWVPAAIRLPARRRRCAPGTARQVLLWAAAFARSVAAARAAVPSAPTGQATGDALRVALPGRRRTPEGRLPPALHAPLPRRPRPARRAIDYHRVPYHGAATRDAARAEEEAGA